MTHTALAASLALAIAASAASAQTMTESLRIDAPLGPTYQPGRFGQAVALGDAGVLAVGSPMDATGNVETGGVYLFDQATGALLRMLKPTTAAVIGQCGYAVDISDGIVAAGSPFEYDGTDVTDSVYLFDASTGVQLHQIPSASGHSFAFFGASVAVHGGTLLVGAPSEDHTGGAYAYDVATGTMLFELNAFDANHNDMFGSAVDLDDHHVVIGSMSLTGGVSGGAYVYAAHTGSFVTKLSPPALTTSFGQAVCITDDAIFVAAPTIVSGPLGSTGAVYKYNATTFALVDTFTPNTPSTFRYGSSISAHDGLLVIGAHEDDNDGYYTGAAFLYDAETGAFLARLEPTSPDVEALFGLSVTTRDGIVAVGKVESPGDDDNGAAHIYRPPFPCGPADSNGDGSLTNTDINLFVTRFQAHDHAADLNADRFFTNTDINLFIAAFLAGCD